MLRAVSSIYTESQALAAARRDVFKLFRSTAFAAISSNQTVLADVSPQKTSPVLTPGTPVSHSPEAPPPPPPPPPPRRGWLTATAIALTASIGGVYFVRKLSSSEQQPLLTEKKSAIVKEPAEPPIPAGPESLPQHVDYLVVGAGTAAFAALRAIRSVKPEASLLLVGDEMALPYMRTPLTKELWREPDLAIRAADPDTFIFSQWNGKKRRLAYEPNSFYTAPEKMREGVAGAGVARGWTVSALDVERHTATLSAAGHSATLTYNKCLIATGVRSARAPALRGAREAGLALAARTVRDVARLAAAVRRAPDGNVLVVGGGAHACELAAGLAYALQDSGKTVWMVYKEESPLADQLPRYLARDAARRLRQLGVRLLPATEVTDSSVTSERVNLQLRRTVTVEDDGEVQVEDLTAESALEATLVVECVGTEANVELAQAAGLEVHPELGGVVVNAEMQARTDVFAAGDVACYYEPVLGRRRVLRHDHAIASGRLAGANMAAEEPSRPYTHQPMMWSDIGPDIGLEGIGVIDSRLPTVSVFCEDSVSESTATTAEQAAAGVQRSPERQYERGVVFYLRDKRVVGVLLWNLFNRMHIARQVLKHGEFEELFEVAKLFSLYEDD